MTRLILPLLLAATLTACIGVSRRPGDPTSDASIGGPDGASTLDASADAAGGGPNQPPVIALVTLGPEAPRTGDTLTCTWSGFSDADGDADASWVAWDVDGAAVGESSPLLSEGFTRGSRVTCTATPFDGRDAGKTLSASVLVGNGFPSIAGVQITPEAPAAGEALTCESHDFSDPEGDPDLSQAVWTIDGALVGVGPTLAAGAASGQTVRCTLTPWDGRDEGTARHAEVTVANTPPSIGGAVIEPAQPTVSDALRCRGTGFTDPDGDADQTTIAWRVGGLDAGTGPELRGGFSRGDNVTCIATPHDGLAAGSPKQVMTTVVNALPRVKAVKLTPELVVPGQPVTCSWQDFEDADGDPDHSTLRWESQGSVLSEEATIVSPAGVGTTLTCRVIPSDGLDEGEAVARTVTLGNAPPSIAKVHITPTPAFGGTPLSCQWTGYSDPEGAPDQSRVTWLVKGKVVAFGKTLLPAVSPGDGVTCRVVPFDGHSEGEAVEATVLIANSLPNVSGVTIQPAGFHTGDTVTCQWQAFHDTDGDPDQSTVMWLINGEPAGLGHSLSAGFVAGDLVRCEVTPHDGISAGPVGSASAVVGDAPPTLTGAIIVPEPARATHSLACIGTGFADTDGDPNQSLTMWRVNGNLVGTGPSLAGAFVAGDDVGCEILPFDGASTGVPVTRSTTIVNTPPQIGIVRLLPKVPVAGEALSCEWGGFWDPDGHPDLTTVSWEVNGQPAGEGATLAMAIGAGDVIRCIARPHDGLDAGQPMSRVATVGFAPPAIASVALTPSTARAGDTLSCAWSGFSDPQGLPDRSSVEWLVDGVVVAEGPTLSAGFAGGNTVTCRVVPWNGQAHGDPVSASLVVENTAPQVAGPVIGPPNAGPGDVLTCSWAEFSDPDGQLDWSTVEWLVNGELVGTGKTLKGGFGLGDTVTCRVTPSDGELEGAPAQAVSVFGNSQPTLQGAQILPSPAYAGTPLICQALGFADADGDPNLTYAVWRLNGKVVASGTVLDGGYARGDRVDCLVTPWDGKSTGALVVAMVEVVNAPPKVAKVAISPEAPGVDDALTCAWSGFQDADGDPDLSEVQWSVDGVPAGTGTALPGPHQPGDEVTCAVTPFDGLEAGVVREATVVVASDGTPVGIDVTKVTLTPAAPVAGDTLTCAWDGPGPDQATVTWLLNDGTLGATGPTLSTPLVRGDVVTCLVTPDLGKAGEASVEVLNTLPSLAGVVITPKTPQPGKTLTCATVGFVDPDGDPDLSTFAWTRNGAPVGTGPTWTGGFAGGDVIACTAVPSDGVGAGSPKVASIVIGNTPPSLQGVALTPASPKATDTLTCTPNGFADPDGDADQTLISWTVDGDVAGTGPTLAGAFQKGQTVACQAIPFDGTDAGTPVSQSTVIQNTPPTLGAASIAPALPTAGDTLTCSGTGFSDADGDGDQSTVAWTVNGSPAGTGPTLSGGFGGGDTVACQLTAHDGTDAGNGVSTSVVATYPPPTVASVDISPATLGAGDVATCAWTGWDDPEGLADQSTVRWLVEGVEAGTGPTLSGAFLRGDTLTCELTPDNGQRTGEPVTTSLVVQNTAPTLTSVGITPPYPKPSDTLTCAASGPADADGDPVSTTFAWRVNGAFAGSGPTLSGAFAAGDEVSCEVEPHDGLDAGPVVARSVWVSSETNTPPFIDALSMSPGNPRTYDTVLANISVIDPDGPTQQVTFMWYVDNELVQEGGTSLDGNIWFNAGQVIRLEASVSDGAHAPVSASTTQTCANSKPGKPAAEITPSPVARDGDDLVCFVAVPPADADSDQTFTYTYAWQRNFVAWGSGPSVPASATAPGDIWKCTVLGHDGFTNTPPDNVEVAIAVPISGVKSGTLPEGGAYELAGDVTVKAGTTWTISKSVKMLGLDRRILVEGGATLRIDGDFGGARVWLEEVTVDAMGPAYGGAAATGWTVDADYMVMDGGALLPTATGGHIVKLVDSVLRDTVAELQCHGLQDKCELERNVFLRAAGVSILGGGGRPYKVVNNAFREGWSGFDVEKLAGAVGDIEVRRNSFLTTELVALSLPPGASGGLTAEDNWWGTTDAGVIDQMVFDAADDPGSPGLVDVSPWLGAPDASTPSVTPWL